MSNEAFTFDELAQVAPIISARLYINCKYICAFSLSLSPRSRAYRRRLLVRAHARRKRASLMSQLRLQRARARPLCATSIHNSHFPSMRVLIRLTRVSERRVTYNVDER